MTINSIPAHPLQNSYISVEEADELLTGRRNTENWDSLDDSEKANILMQASRQIDTLRFHHQAYFNNARYNRSQQGLKYPNTEARRSQGKVQSSGANYIVSSQLANRSHYPDDIFNNGSLIITRGTGVGQTLQVSDFEYATGKITVSQNFSTQPDTTSSFIIIEAIPARVKYAVIEQALFILAGGGERARLQAEGVESYSIGDLSEKFRAGAGAGGDVAISPEAKGYLTLDISRIGILTR